MYNLKGFFGYPALVNNAPDTIAIFGELSDNSLTYAKDKTLHTGASTPNTAFISFHSVKDENVIDVAGEYKNQILKLGEFLYTESIAGTIGNDPDVLRQIILSEFGSVIREFKTGRMLTDGNLWLPEWIEFELIDTEPNQINIWLADESFAAQYDEYVIEIIHPIEPFDDFFKDPLVVKQLLDNYNLVEKLDEVQSKRDKYPYTHQRGFVFDYNNPRDTSIKYPAYWIAIVYGEAGNNPDLIKDKIVEELLAGSTRPREDWEAILPDLFMTTEFIFTPFWNQYSIPNSDLRAGIYSPIIDPRKRLSLIKRTARGPGYTETYVENRYELSANIYKSIAFSVLGNPQNRGGITQFSAKFPDYMIVSNDSGDINRADPITIDWMLLFGRLLKAAEVMTRYSSVPSGISRMSRDGVLYASAYYKNVNYMVVAKTSVEELS